MSKKSKSKHSKFKESKSKDSKTKQSKPQRRREKVDQGRFTQSCPASPTSEVRLSPPKVASEREWPRRQLQELIARGKASQVRALLSSHPWLLEEKYLKFITKATPLPPNPRQGWPQQARYEAVCHHYSPLHLATMHGRPKIVKVLLECGADVMATTGPPEKLLPPKLILPEIEPDPNDEDKGYNDRAYDESNLMIDSGNFIDQDSINQDSDIQDNVTDHLHYSYLHHSHSNHFHLYRSNSNESSGHLPFRSNRTMHLPLYYAVLPDALLADAMLSDDMLSDVGDVNSGGNDRGYPKRNRPSVRMRVARLLLRRMRQVVAEEWFYDLTLAETIEQVICDTNNPGYLNDEYIDDEPFDEIFALEVLHGAKADWEARDRQGFSALHQAVIWENIVAYEWLIENGVDPNPTNHTGNTPLHLALWWGSDPMLLAVLRSPCDPLLPNDMGVSSYEMVLRSGCPVLRKLFEAHPAIQEYRQNQNEE